MVRRRWRPWSSGQPASRWFFARAFAPQLPDAAIVFGAMRAFGGLATLLADLDIKLRSLFLTCGGAPFLADGGQVSAIMRNHGAATPFRLFAARLWSSLACCHSDVPPFCCCGSLEGFYLGTGPPLLAEEQRTHPEGGLLFLCEQEKRRASRVPKVNRMGISTPIRGNSSLSWP